jgi:hypothetical protein
MSFLQTTTTVSCPKCYCLGDPIMQRKEESRSFVLLHYIHSCYQILQQLPLLLCSARIRKGLPLMCGRVWVILLCLVLGSYISSEIIIFQNISTVNYAHSCLSSLNIFRPSLNPVKQPSTPGSCLPRSAFARASAPLVLNVFPRRPSVDGLYHLRRVRLLE